MKYSDFPSIGRPISKLGFGLMRLPKLYEDKEDIDRKEAERLVDLAYKAGVNYFDTAYVYHNGESEYFAGEALKKYPRESYCLATKLPGWVMRSKGASAEELFEEQLKKCGVDYFDFYLLHNVNDENWATFTEGKAYEYCLEQKRKGRIKHLGFSFHGDLKLLKKITDEYKWDFAQLQLNYYDWEASQGKEFYEALESHNIPCIVMEPVRGGSLHQLNDEARKVFEELGDKTPASYALRYVAQLPNVLVTLSGMSAIEQVEDNLATFNDLKNLSDEESKAVEKANILFRKNFAVPCTGCKYCVATCPSGIDIPGCFKAFNKYNETRNIEDFKTAYEKIEIKADQCVKCKVCMEHCPQNINIPDKLERLNNLK